MEEYLINIPACDEFFASDYLEFHGRSVVRTDGRPVGRPVGRTVGRSVGRTAG